jgi:hypothetical protein
MPDNDKVTIWGGIPRFGTTPTTGQAIAGGGNGFVIYDSAIDNINIPASRIRIGNQYKITFAGSTNFVLLGSANNNVGTIFTATSSGTALSGTGIVSIEPTSATPLPNKNMELANKTITGVITQYYGFAGYSGSYYSTSTQANLAAQNLVNFNQTSIQYGVYLTGSPTSRLTVQNAGVYRISGTLDFYCTDVKPPTSVPITLSGTIPLTSTSAPVSSASGTGSSQNITINGPLPETITVNGQTITISGQTADLTGIDADLSGATGTVDVEWDDVALETSLGVWIRKNGVDVPWTKRAYSLIGNEARMVVSIDYMLVLENDEYAELVWESASANTSLYNAATDYPSALINITLVR